MNKNSYTIDSKNFDLTRSSDGGFLRYLNKIYKFPLLTPEQEFNYSVRFAENNDKEAAKMLIQSHLRLVVKIATKFKSYGLPIVDLVAEGNLGLIQALKKFEPHKGFRFSTYAMWWIRAFIQDYVLRSWSLVKMGTSLAQKKLFFNLNKIKKRLGIRQGNDGVMSVENVSQIANILNVSQQEVLDMDSRLSQSDTSLNNLVGDEENGKEVIETMSSDQESQEEIAIFNQEKSKQEELFRIAFSKLNEREQDILIKRRMSEKVTTLEELSQHYKISRERVRQIEENVIRKIKKEISQKCTKAT